MQRRTSAILLAAIIAGGFAASMLGGLSVAQNERSSAKSQEKVLRHIVMYKFKDDQSKAQVQQVIDAFAGLPKKIDAIIDFEHGTNVSAEGKSEGFTHCFVVTFRTEADRDRYLKHTAHDDYVKVVKDRREKVIVFDYLGKPLMPKVAPTESKPRRVPMLLQLGCAHVAVLLIAAGCLLVANTLAVSSAFQVWTDLQGNRRQDPRIAQSILILCPLILLFLQYWLYDRIRNWMSRSVLGEGE